MDYKKEYDDICQKLMSAYNTTSFVEVRKAIEGIHPELRESEDERHRKWILEYLYDGLRKSDEQFKDQFKSAIDWLEKQKEQKPAEWNANDKAFIKDCAHILDENGYAASAERLLSMSPVRSAEWSDTDNIGWDEAFACVTRAEKAAKNEEELQNAVTAEKWLKEIKFKYCVHPVKPEWSKEDEKRVKQLIYDTEHIRAEYEKRKKELGESFNDELIKDCDKQIDWLKSLRPSWKPSEWQMSMLLAVINDPNNAGSESCYLTLKSIYEQLKKLM